ncbi:tRNA (adenosine(37)-N6)-dimethylallyltransferase MiaA [Candidatus Shikimatogenerans bostrichidophilus]|uniref:tRNA (adenosine(37)-N6)-dimethylallyltransferase MiaA n=1 Tax=Candidatus Shikimatogenerans bostrichidophilus TaxID=2943807 RepID=UPI00296635A5
MNTLISIVGPTGIGKTKLSIYLAKKFKTEIISCDSRQFYKQLNIGTSKPSKKQLKQIKHHFIGHLNIKNNYNISLFEKEVIKKLIKLFKKYKIIIMVGGSGLYEKTIIEGINIIPNINKKKKLKIRKILNKKNLEYLLNKLKKKDINYYYLLKNKKDKRKIIKALEFKYCTNKTISSFYYKKKIKRPFKRYIRIGLIKNRKKIYNKINKKVDLMIKKGLINEAKKYYKYKKFNSLNTIGYKEIFKYLNNKFDKHSCIELIKQKTRNYAKKQIIWFKRYNNIKWFKHNNYKKIYIYLNNKLKKK